MQVVLATSAQTDAGKTPRTQVGGDSPWKNHSAGTLTLATRPNESLKVSAKPAKYPLILSGQSC